MTVQNSQHRTVKIETENETFNRVRNDDHNSNDSLSVTHKADVLNNLNINSMDIDSRVPTAIKKEHSDFQQYIDLEAPSLQQKYSVQKNPTQTQPKKISQPTELDEKTESSLIQVNYFTYLLHIAGIFTGGLSSFLALFISYKSRGGAKESWLATHFDWQIKTFWYSMLLNVLAVLIGFLGVSGVIGGLTVWSASLGFGSLLFLVLTGFVIFISGLLFFYRNIMGIIALVQDKPI